MTDEFSIRMVRTYLDLSPLPGSALSKLTAKEAWSEKDNVFYAVTSWNSAIASAEVVQA